MFLAIRERRQPEHQVGVDSGRDQSQRQDGRNDDLAALVFKSHRPGNEASG